MREGKLAPDPANDVPTCREAGEKERVGELVELEAIADIRPNERDERQHDHGKPRRLLAKRATSAARRSLRYAVIPEHGNQTPPPPRGRTGPTGG